MASDGQIVINTKLNDHGLKQGITGLQDTTITALNKVKGVLATVGIGVSVAAAVKGVNNLIKSTAEYTDRIDKQSQKIGMSKRGYQEWDFILSDLGANVDGLQLGLKTLSSAMDEANRGNKEYGEMFKRLGVNIKDTNGNLKDQETIFNEVFDALAGMESQTERTAIASRLLGRSATELAPALNAGADEIEFLKNRAYELNTVLDDTTIAIGVNFADQVGRMKRALQTASARAIAPFMDDLADLATSFSDETIPALEKFMTTAVKVGLSIPPVFAFMKAVVVQVLKEIGEALDGPWEKLKSFVNDLLNMPVVKNTIDLAIDLAGDLWDGLKKGATTGEWGDFWKAAVGAAEFAIGIMATIKLAGMAGAVLWSSIQSGLKAAGFGTAGLMTGTIAMLSVGLAVVEAMQDNDYSGLAANMIAALTAALVVGGLTKSSTVGMLAFSVALNFKVGETIMSGLVPKPYQGDDAGKSQVQDIIGSPEGLLSKWGATSAARKKLVAIWGVETGRQILAGLGIGLADIDKIGEESARVLLSTVQDELGIQSPSREFKRIGNELVNGLESGLEGMPDAGKEGAQGFLDAVQDTLGVHSESTEAHWIGNEFVNGLINGLIELMPELEAEAEKLRDALAKIWTEQPTIPPAGGGGGGGGSPIAIKPGFGDIWSDTKAGWKAALDDMKRDAEDWTTFTKNIFASIPGAFGNAIAQGMRSLGQNLAEQTEIIAQLEDSILSLEDKLADSYDDLEDAQKAYAKAVLSGDSDAIRNAEKRVRQQEKIISGHEKSLKALKDEKKSVEDGSKAWKDFARTILNALANELYGLGAQLAARAILSALTWNWAGAAMATAGSAAAFGAAILVDSWAGSFAEGGIVPQVAGLPSSGDRHVASVNPGELILNAAQQQSIATQLAVLSKLTEIIAAMTIATNGTGPYIDLRGSTFNSLSEEEVGRAVYRNIKTLQHEGVLEAW